MLQLPLEMLDHGLEVRAVGLVIHGLSLSLELKNYALLQDLCFSSTVGCRQNMKRREPPVIPWRHTAL